MEYTDTINLLKECDAGSKMAVKSIDDVLEMVEKTNLLSYLLESKKEHKVLGAKIHKYLNELNCEEKDPSFMAESMSYMKTSLKMFMNPKDETIADLMIQGCDMGIKSLYKYLNEYKKADDKAKDLCKDLIEIEEKLKQELVAYL